MYKLNSDRMLSESEIIETATKRLNDCITKLKALEKFFYSLNSDEELAVLATKLRNKIEKQQQTIHQLSYVLSAVSNTVTINSKQEVSVCEKASEIQKCLVLSLLRNNCNKVDPTLLPIMFTISN